MNKKYKELSKNTIILTISNFGSKIMSFFLVPLYTAVLTTKEYGTLDLVTTTTQLLIPLFTLNIQDSVLRFSLDKNYKKEDVFLVAVKTICFSSVFLLFALKVLCIFFEPGIFQNKYLVFLFCVYLTGTTNNCLNMYLRSANKMKIVGIFGVVNTAVVCATNILLLLFFKLGVNGYMIAYISGTLVANCGLLFFGNIVGDLKRGKSNAELTKSMLVYGIPLIANSVAWWINNASDRYILTYFSGVDINGIYSLSYKIPSILAMLQSTFYSAWSISAITEFNRDDGDGFVGNVFSFYTIASIIACSGIMIMNGFIAKLIYSNSFFAAWKYVPMLMVGTVFNGLGLFVGCLFTAVKNTKIISLTTTIGAAINTLMNFLLIPKLGAHGAALSTLIGYCSVFIIRLIFLKNVIKMKVKWSIIFSGIIILGIQCIIATLSIKMVYQIMPVLLILVINRHTIKKIIKIV